MIVDTEIPKKYNITDFYWLLNPKLINRVKLETNEIEFVTLGFNQDYNNFRISVYKLNKDTITNNSIFKNRAKFLFNINVFSETFYQIKYNINKTTTIHNFERFVSNVDYKPIKTIFEIGNNIITVKSKIEENIYFYEFTEWQLDVLMLCCEFMINVKYLKPKI